MAIGQAIDGQPASSVNEPSAGGAPSPASSAPAAGQPQAITDEQLMREMEDALTTSRVTPLVALDEMTPRVRAAAIDVR